MQGEIGLGTYNLLGKECEKIVRLALEMGYRLIDTASVYENHREVGKAISDFDRSQLKIVSKIWIEEEVDDQDIDGSIKRACEKALKELSTDYLDIYLIHWPSHTRPLNQMLSSMVKLKDEGLIREVGVSNFTQHHLQDAYDETISISWNQIELHPLLSQKPLVNFAKEHGTKIMAYRPFGKGKLIKDISLFSEIGKAHGKSPAQVILKWITQQGITAVPKASSEKHLKENFDIGNFALSESEMQALDALNSNHRFCDKEFGEFDY